MISAIRCTISLVALAISTSVAAEDVPLTRDAEPDIDHMATISTGDYPDASLMANEQGKVEVEYEIDEKGRVTPRSCVVKRSSGYDRLDRRSCQIVEQRYRFRPALADGQPVESRRTQPINWSIPGQPPADPAARADEAIRKVNHLGRCVARANPELAQRIVDLPLGSPEQTTLVQSINGRTLKCVHPEDKLQYAPGLLVGPLAEGLWLTRFDKSLPSLPAGAVHRAAQYGKRG